MIPVRVGIGRVTSVRVAEVGAHHVSLVWQSPGGASGIELYEVSFWTRDDSSRRNISLAYSFHTNITLRRLRRQTVYMFRVSTIIARLFLALDVEMCSVFSVFSALILLVG